MATLTIKLPSQKEQTDFNLRRWNELLADPEMAKSKEGWKQTVLAMSL